MNYDFTEDTEDFELKTHTAEELKDKAEAEKKQEDDSNKDLFISYKGFPEGVYETSSVDNVFVFEKTLRAPMPENYKKIPYFINEELYDELLRQPCSINKSIPFLLEWALKEIKRQKKQIVIDMKRPIHHNTLKANKK